MMTKMHADQHDKKFRKKARASYYGEAIGSIQPPWHACFAAPLLDSRLPCSVCPKEGCIHMEFCWSAPTLPSAALHNVLDFNGKYITMKWDANLNLESEQLAFVIVCHP